MNIESPERQRERERERQLRQRDRDGNRLIRIEMKQYSGTRGERSDRGWGDREEMREVIQVEGYKPIREEKNGEEMEHRERQ